MNNNSHRSGIGMGDRQNLRCSCVRACDFALLPHPQTTGCYIQSSTGGLPPAQHRPLDRDITPVVRRWADRFVMAAAARTPRPGSRHANPLRHRPRQHRNCAGVVKAARSTQPQSPRPSPMLDPSRPRGIFAECLTAPTPALRPAAPQATQPAYRKGRHCSAAREARLAGHETGENRSRAEKSQTARPSGYRRSPRCRPRGSARPAKLNRKSGAVGVWRDKQTQVAATRHPRRTCWKHRI